MREPSLRTSRLAIAGGLIVAIAVGAAGFQLGRQTSPRPAPAPSFVPSTRPPPTVTVQRQLGRAEVLALAAEAADALSSAAPLPNAVSIAAGRRFELVLPFGCDGPSDEDSTAPLRWIYDPDAEALRIHVETTLWQPADWALAGEAATRIEGFWIARPWSGADRCPRGNGQAAASGAQPLTLPGQTIAVAEFAAAARDPAAAVAPRVFDTVKRVAPDALQASQGFRIRLIGRVATVPGNGPVRCIQPAGIEQQPICAVAAALDELRIENPESGDVLASWSLARVARAE